jgi:hypothetical protein
MGDGKPQTVYIKGRVLTQAATGRSALIANSHANSIDPCGFRRSAIGCASRHSHRAHTES